MARRPADVPHVDPARLEAPIRLDSAASLPAAPAMRRFLNLTFNDMTLGQAVDAIRWAGLKPEWSYVVTPNAAHLARLRHDDPELRRIYAQAGMCLLDSRVVAKAARLLGLKPPHVVTGADLVAALVAQLRGRDTRLCIIGGSATMVAHLRAAYGLMHIAQHAPPMGFWQHQHAIDTAADFVIDSQADLTFLCVGSPQQEMLANHIAKRGGARGIGICAGASLDFLTGVQRRAPRALQRWSLEWAYRLCAEPRRMARRYLVESPQGLMLVLQEAWHPAQAAANGPANATGIDRPLIPSSGA